jgi:hypothetical protein
VKKCGVCGRSFSEPGCHIITLTDEEKQELRSRGETPLEEYVFCKPCWKTLSDPVSGPAFGRGLIQQQLQQFGVGGAEKAAARFHAKLVARINKPKPS